MTDNEIPAGTTRAVDTVVIDLAIRLALIGLLLYWSLLLIGPFVTIVIWGVILAVALYPTFVWLRRLLGQRGGLAAIVITAVFLLIIIGPVSLLGAAMVQNIQSFAGNLEAGNVTVPPPNPSVQDWPLVGNSLYEFWSLASENLQTALARIGPELKGMGTTLLGVAAGLGLGLLKFIASVIVAGCLLVPGLRLSSGLTTFAERVAAGRGQPFVLLASATIRNVARGVIGVALLQSLLIGVGLLVAGVPFAGLITIGCLFLGIIQIGPGILVLGTIVWAWTDMGTVGAAVYTVYMIPMLLFDNFLKPIVMSRGLSTPMLVIFIGVIGGTLLHGIIGLFVGPIVLAVAYELAVFWVRGEGPGTIEQPVPEQT